MTAPTEHEMWAYNHIVVGKVRRVRMVKVIEVVSLTGLGLPDSPASKTGTTARMCSHPTARSRSASPEASTPSKTTGR